MHRGQSDRIEEAGEESPSGVQARDVRAGYVLANLRGDAAFWMCLRSLLGGFYESDRRAS